MVHYRLAVLGDPVDHSRSPTLHTAMLRLAGLDGEYLRVRADAETLRRAIDSLRGGEWHGLNVTMPLKADAARMADSLSPTAADSGSVNTLVRSDAGVTGHSTDCSAFEELLASERFREVDSVLVLGAGGSSAAALAAIPADKTVYVSARRISAAEATAARLGGNIVPWATAGPGALMINATPLGMSGELLPDGLLAVAAGLVDLPYGSEPTPAVTDARSSGIPVADGHEFLLRQAMHSFRLWTGVAIDFAGLSQAVRNV